MDGLAPEGLSRTAVESDLEAEAEHSLDEHGAERGQYAKAQLL